MRARADLGAAPAPFLLPGEPARIVLSGCGAVSRQYYSEALSRLQVAGRVNVVGIFDPDIKAAEGIRAHLPSAVLAANFDDLLSAEADIAIIASPPAFHADQCVTALCAGMHVLCEKPLATSVTDADRIVSAAKANGRLVATGLMRRHFPAIRSIKSMLDAGLIGRLKKVTCFEGGPFRWPVASIAFFARTSSGGGVLQDIGTHALDLLTWWLGKPISVDYADDAMGGVEANCEIHLTYDGFDAIVRLSRDWARPNQYRFEAERGVIVWNVNETQAVEVSLHCAGTNTVATFADSSGSQRDFIDSFCNQIIDLIDASSGDGTPLVPASAGRDVLALIEACYASRRAMDMPWLSPEERPGASDEVRTR